MTHELFITELASYKDSFAYLIDSDRNMWHSLYKGDESDTEKALRDISEQASMISKIASTMRTKLQTVK